MEAVEVLLEREVDVAGPLPVLEAPVPFLELGERVIKHLELKWAEGQLL